MRPLLAIVLLIAVACTPNPGRPDSGTDAGAKGPPPDGYPLQTPMLFGYTLEDAFPQTLIFGAMQMEWPKGSNEPFVLQGSGALIRIRANGSRDVALDWHERVAQREEAGALGMALHPKFADAVAPQPYIYVWWNEDGTPTHQRLTRWTYDAAQKIFDPASEFTLVAQAEKSLEHNSARLHFGPDGFLYFGNGDDTRPDETAQRLDAGLFSGLFRIDVDMQGGAVSHPPTRQPSDAVTQGYFIPNDNPFVGLQDANEEYFALGFRNPYAFTFDPANGDLWLGDVGDTWREEIDKIVKGGNYGWPYFEGKLTRRMGAPGIGTLTAPAFDYAHATMGDLSAIMMGAVYRGSALPELAGKIIYADWPVGRVWAFDPATSTRQTLFEWNNPAEAPIGFGQDGAGEVYGLSWRAIFKLARASGPHSVPTKLSQTHLFDSVADFKPSAWLKPYTIRSPLWSDGAAKQRWIYVPDGKVAAMNADGGMQLPPGSLLVKQFDLPEEAQPSGGRTRHLETRVLVVGETSTYGVTYRWNHDGTEGDLVLEAAEEHIDDANPAESRVWHFPSSGECWSCHREENRVLGFKPEQLNFDGQLQSLGMFDAATLANAPPPIASPADTTASADARFGAYVAANCSPCHHPGAAYLGGVSWNALANVAPMDRGLINEQNHNAPMAGALGLSQWGPLVKPGDPMGSVLRGRVAATDQDLRMPPLLRTRVDPVGLAVVDAWIMSLPP